MDCTTARENIDAYALGALDTDDLHAFEEHIANCDECEMLVRAAQDDAALIALAPPVVAARSALKARVIASAGVLTDIRRRRRGRWWAAAAASLAAASIGVLFWAGYLQKQVHDLHNDNTAVAANATASAAELSTVTTQLVRSEAFQNDLANSLAKQDEVIDVVSQPDVRRTQLIGTAVAPTATGRYLWSQEEQSGAFVGANLAALPEGLVYHLWLVYDGKWVNACVFTVDAAGRGRCVVHPRDSVVDEAGALRGFAVSIEPAVAVTGRTGAMVLQNFSR